MKDIESEIVIEIAVLSESDSGYTKEINLVSWNEKPVLSPEKPISKFVIGEAGHPLIRQSIEDGRRPLCEIKLD